MRNPSRTLQNSIFEPLYSDQDELQFLQPTIPITPVTFSIAPAYTKVTMKRAAATIFDDNISTSSSNDMAREFACTHETPTTSDHGMCLPSNASGGAIVPASPPFCPPIRSLSASDVVNPDDGSVASKLLSSITKSISSPSLVACCKESARETPYQKSLRLKAMKLEYCAEELGSESCDGSLHGGEYFNSIFDSPSNMSSSQSSENFSASHQKSQSNYASSKLFSVRSSPNLGCSSSAPKPTSQSIKERSFPPPLSHTLPRSTSLDSFSYSLRAFREDGHFVLREFEVPCRQYFQANRKDGRLTLKCLTTDEDLEGTRVMYEAHINKGREYGRVGACSGVCGDVASDKARDGSSDKIEVESAKTRANLVGRLEVCGVKGSKNGVDSSNERTNVKEFGCLLPESLSNGKNGSVNVMSHVGTNASSEMKSDFKTAKLKIASGKASCMHLSSTDRHLLSTLSSQLLLLHFPGKNRSNFKLSSDLDTIKGTQCAEIWGLESTPARGISLGVGKASRVPEITPARSWSQRSDHGNSPSSTITFKDVSAKSSVENVSQPVASFELENGGKWGSCGKEINLKVLDENVFKLCSGGMMESSMHKLWVKNINIGVSETSCSGCSRQSIYEALFDVKPCDRGCNGEAAYREGDRVIDDVARLRCLPSSSFHCGVQISPPLNVVDRSAPPLQGKEWLQSLHCKEIFHRKLAKGAFIKLHCVA